MPPRGRAVTFDLWHTLLYLAPDAEDEYMRRQIEIAVDALRALPSERNGPTLPDSRLRTAFEHEYLSAVGAAGEGRSVPPEEQFRRAARAVHRQARTAGYLDALKRLVEATGFRVAPGAKGMLQELHESGFRIGVISNTVGEPGAYFRPRLRTLGWDRWIQLYTFSDEHPWTKPAPEIFRTTLHELGVEPDSAVHVGDGPSDLDGARRAGLRAGILFSGLQEYGEKYRALFSGIRAAPDRPELEVDRLEAVPPLVRRLLPG
jgi:putative hydrolase of the HAD superfamily